eukprot:TRINITY_DN100036_c0_g1_i1.p1 TRINITY_DN100036_c0_g1~~TRINITY_DN100036_c0_g1_i1.p1  ORF type:complete len:202 (+),score=26.33 TRINITY_DN100036_c0_g1_i1:44-649(+)
MVSEGLMASEGISETQARLILQLAEKNRENAIAGIRTKIVIVITVFALGVVELILASLYNDVACPLPLASWLLADGITACLSESLGLVSLSRAETLISKLSWEACVELDDKVTELLDGKFQLVAKLSDASDILLVLFAATGFYWHWQTADADIRCTATLRTWTGRVLLLKFLGPLTVCGMKKLLFPSKSASSETYLRPHSD